MKLEWIDIDVSRENQMLEMIRRAIAVFGRVALYVKNAAWTRHRPISRLNTESLINTLITNLFACIWASREISKHMI